MEIKNFDNSISHSLCDYAFYLSKSLMAIAYLLYAVLFKHIVNWALVLTTFNVFFRKKVNVINIHLGRILYCIFYLHSCRTSSFASVYYS